MDCKSLNYGGFVSPSTVDWPGRSVSVVFFRGCSLNCFYCHNKHICHGIDERSIDEIKSRIEENSILTSGVVFSGGECTDQSWALKTLCLWAKDMGYAVGIHTSGTSPSVIYDLIRRKCVDFVSLDLKSTWDLYPEVIGQNRASVVPWIRESLRGLTLAYETQDLKEFRVAYTVYNTDLTGLVRSQVEPIVPFVVQEKR
jgi:pyruvate formate lyase activating enzyme